MGAGVGGLLLLALLVLFIIRRRRRADASDAARMAAETAPSETAVASPSYTYQSMSSPASELEPKIERPWGQVGNPMNRAELWGGGRRMDATELDAGA